MTPIHIPADVWTEAFKSADWYDQQRDGLGADLMQPIDDALVAIKANPLQFPIVDRDTRCARTKRFPVGIFYSIDIDEVLIFAMQDLRRSPRRWKKRKKKK
jgi:hypothetical protein